MYVSAQGQPLAQPIPIYEDLAMAALCLFFVGLCVRSFIKARKERETPAVTEAEAEGLAADVH